MAPFRVLLFLIPCFAKPADTLTAGIAPNDIQKDTFPHVIFTLIASELYNHSPLVITGVFIYADNQC